MIETEEQYSLWKEGLKMKEITNFLKSIYRVQILPIQEIYLKYRSRFPTIRHLRYSGILISHEIKMLDMLFPKTRIWDVENYEQAILEGLKDTLRPGDNVVIVGGGFGVTVCFAAKCVGSKGSVVCYEGNLESCEHVRQAAKLNGVSSIVKVLEGIVSSDVGVYDGAKATHTVEPRSLPTCDVLQLDCEGAETEIISKLAYSPRAIIVETHGFLGAPTESTASILEFRGYSVDNIGVAEPRFRELCEINDIRCLIARKKRSTM